MIEVKVPNTLDWENGRKRSSLIRRWCNDNCSDVFDVTNCYEQKDGFTDVYVKISFKNRNDALRFKLTYKDPLA